MKKLTRIATILLAVALLASTMLLPAMAATHTISIENATEGHTYEAYQIFTGSLNASGIMTAIQWGASVSDTGKTTLGNAETKANALKTVADATAFGYEVDEYLTAPVGTTSTVTTLGNGNQGYEITGLATGYYLVKDMTGSVDSSTHDAYTQYIIVVVDDVEVAPKSSVPTLTKKVSRDLNTNYQTAVSSTIGDTVYFRLEATMPSHIDDYSTYYMELTDTLPAGLDYVSVHHVGVVNGADYINADLFTETTDYTVTAAGKNVTVTLKDIKASILSASGNKALRDDKIIVVYSAKPNKDIVIGEAGNTNAAIMVYSNDPNETYTPATDAKPSHTGTTPRAEATVYSYKLQLKKISALDNSVTLPNAGFVLYRNVSNVPQYATVENGRITGFVASQADATEVFTDAGGMLNIAGVASGTVHLKETTPPDGFNLLTTEIGVTIAGTLNAATGKLDTFSAEATGTTHKPVVDKAAGTVLVTVENRPGTALPETGGMGTTIFYIAGAALVVGALVVLASKKRAAEK